nr:hypothetical protein [Prevotella sp. UBA4952]
MESIIFGVRGGCLDSNRSPMRLKDGDEITAHEVPINERQIIRNLKRLVCIVLNDGNAYVKMLAFYDGAKNIIGLKCFEPEETTYYVPISIASYLFVVDEVL